jgi:glycerol-3-phosphate dehydrogenase (NAD(P)+)
MVVEGEYTVLSAYNIARDHGLDLPIVTAMHEVIYQDKDPRIAFEEMLLAINSSQRQIL